MKISKNTHIIITIMLMFFAIIFYLSNMVIHGFIYAGILMNVIQAFYLFMFMIGILELE